MTLYYHNSNRLGDTIWDIQFFRRLLSLNMVNTIYYYIDPTLSSYKELEQHVGEYSGRIIVSHIVSKPVNSISTWIGENGYFYENCRTIPLNKMLENNYSRIINKNIFDYSNALFDFPFQFVENKINDSFDILFINSRNLSNHAPYNENDIHEFLNKYKKDYKIITTQKVQDLPCTTDYGLTTLDIGKLSTKVKFIVAYNTSPLIPCLNKATLHNVEKIYYIDNVAFWYFGKKVERINKFSEIKLKINHVIKKTYKSSDVRVAITTYKRENISNFCIETVKRGLHNAELCVYNDTEQRIGIDKQRLLQFSSFLNSDKQLLYLTDNDAIHDYNYMDILLHYYNELNMPISLYNSSKLDTKLTKYETDTLIYTKHCPGISMLLSRKDVILIMESIKTLKKQGWDWWVCSLLDVFAITKISFVEHIGIDGLHNNNYGNDIAVNPTEFLKIKLKEFFLNYGIQKML